ncbi:P-loop NTPase family protein [Glycomyces tarimensis]
MTSDDTAKCDIHRGSPAVGCGYCLTDAKVDGDKDAIARWHAAVGRLECDQRFPSHFRYATADHPAVLAWARQWTPTTAPERSLILAGSVGTGKTHQGLGALRLAAESGRALRFEVGTASDFYASLRPRDKHDTEAVMARWRTADVVMLDDLGAAKLTEWAEEQTYRLINHRYETDAPSIITTNVTPARFSEVLGDRIASRLAEAAAGHLVALVGDDRRRTPKKGTNQ